MAGNSTISITFKLEGDGSFKQLTADAGGLKRAMTEAIVQANQLNKSLINWSQAVQGISAVNNAINQLNGVIQNVTAESRSFAGAMKAANTMAGKDAAGFDKLKDQVSELSKTIPLAREELANGLYQVISNGVPEDNWISYLEASAKSAVGGIADVGEVVKVTSTIIKNYGMSWDAAQGIQDKIQLTAKNGVTSFEQMAAALPSVTGQAAQLGVSLDEMLAVMSTLTGVTGNTSEVSTQLASVLTSLTKESSKAQKVAAEMGIEFNAASIKAAGGFGNFLKELDATVTAYAAKTGQLKESIYSKLFGRAEALRLVNALTGDLAAKYDENMQVLDNSAGTIADAFETMASTGSATNQMLKNQRGAVTDLIASITSGIAPYMDFFSQLGMSAMSVMALNKTFKALHITQGLVILRTASLKAVFMLSGMSAQKAAQAVRVLSAAMKSGSYSAIALKVALRGLLSATVVGGVLVALGYAVEKLIEHFDNAGDAAKGAAEKITTVEDAAKSAQQVYESTQADTYSNLMTKFKDLQAAWKALATQQAKSAWIKKNQKEFAALGLEITTTTDAENAFERNTSAVVNAFTARAKAAARLAQITEEYRLQMELTEKIDAANAAKAAKNKTDYKADDLSPEKGYHTIEGGFEYLGRDSKWHLTQKGAERENRENSTAWDAETAANRKAYDESVARSKKIEEQIEADAKSLQPIKIPTPITDDDDKNKNKKDVLIENAKSYADLTHNIGIYKRQLEAADPANTELTASLREQIAAAEDAAAAAQALQNGWDLQNPKSLDEVNAAISRQQSLRKSATAETIGQYDAEIARLEDIRRQIELNSHTPIPIGQIQTYKQLESELSYYNELLKTASAEERTQIQTQINALNDLKTKWDEVLNDLKKPAPVTALNTIKDLDEAIAYYEAKQKTAGENEVAVIERVIQAYRRKKEAIERATTLPQTLKEVRAINQLTGREYKVKIQAMGFDELTAKIRELKKMLADTENPVTPAQRKDINELIGTYEAWRKEGVTTFDTFRDGWNNVKGISSGITGMSEAIKGNGTAWEKTTAIVDGFISIYDGVMGIVKIIDMLSIATTTNTAVTATNSTAKTTNAVANTTLGTANAALSTAQITGASTATAEANANLVDAAAKTFNAHSWMPWVGVALAAAGVAVMIATMAKLPKYAKGGIAYGPTLGLFGEYAGASNNPEVVAPLDRLRGMLQPADGLSGEVEFKIKNDYLAGTLKRHNRKINRT